MIHTKQAVLRLDDEMIDLLNSCNVKFVVIQRLKPEKNKPREIAMTAFENGKPIASEIITVVRRGTSHLEKKYKFIDDYV